MQISEFDYFLPSELIAQHPAHQRDGSRMLIVDRAGGEFSDSTFSTFPPCLRPADVLVLNNTKVFPARLIGHTVSGARIEIFLVAQNIDGLWEALAKPARRLKEGKRVVFGDKLYGEVVQKAADGKIQVRFDVVDDFYSVLAEVGTTPLPPYIKRRAETVDADRERYQTVFARERGAIAAPTAGLHFTPEILDEIRSMEVEIAQITLHVGYGTFEPVRADDLAYHRVSAENYRIDQETAAILNSARTGGRRLVAVGTTTTRALEANIALEGRFSAGEHKADLTITPGYEFRAVDALLTNFHLPQSSLLVLTSTFGGHKLIMDAYQHAVAQRYRFYSYGDCMFIS